MKNYFKRISIFSVILILVFTSIFTYINIRYESILDFENTILNANHSRVLNVSTGDYTNKELNTMKEYLTEKLKAKGVLGIWENINLDLYYAHDITNDNGTQSKNVLISVYEMPEKDCFLGKKTVELENNEIIIPKYYSPNIINKYDGKEYIDGETLIGKKIKLEIPYEYNKKETFIYEAKVVGVFDNIKYGNTNPMIFTSNEDYIEIMAKYLDISKEAVIDRTSGISVYCTKSKYYEEFREIAIEGKYYAETLGSSVGDNEYNSLENNRMSKEIYTLFRNIILGVYIFILLIVLIVKIKNKKKLLEITNYLIEIWITQIVSLLIFLPYILKRWFEVRDLTSIERYNTYNYHIYMFLIPLLIMIVSIILYKKGMKVGKDNG